MLAWGVAAIGLALWGAWFCFGSVTVYEVSRKARLEVRQAAHSLAAPLAGRVVANRLVLGTLVREGEVLVEFDAAGARLRLREEQARQRSLAAQTAALKKELAARGRAITDDRDAARAALQGARARSDEAAVAAAHAADRERRLREESEAGGVAQADALQARAQARQLAAAQLAAAAEARRSEADALARGAQQRAQVDTLLRTLAGLDGEQAASAEAAALLQLEIERHLLRAPVGGRVGEVFALRSGDTVGAGQKFASIVPAGELIVVAEFEPAAVLGRVRAGQPARLRLDGFPWAQYGSVDATVCRIGSEVHDGTIRVELATAARAPGAVSLQHGLPGAVEIMVEQLAPALLVLRAAGQRLAGGAATPTAPP